ncbi:MAG: histidine phosphatase family protein [Paracoccus sp. (in: a-proteobacteria)]|uniref:histidine phosphatase family protein n=1 Tax=Paracoccus sp. TaxID=267 RepID=UPI0026DF04BD|nr:histidine phosphatase family protein [Paracoccus sp. (in: a-proteobacteria)]MDO5621979.1 histidine phosphatase family protein [Paracoccus sp. (in: a-proteobacteria)]
MQDSARLTIIRHAPPLNEGRLAGRRDVPADVTDTAAFARVAAALPPAQMLVSPALRCRMTAEALGLSPTPEERLWEQHFGEWEGIPFADLPNFDMPEDAAGLAAYRPSGGESFLDMAARVQPVLAAQRGEVVIVAHAGTAKAAIALVAGASALSFNVAPLSRTILTRHGPHWAVEAVNLLP